MELQLCIPTYYRVKKGQTIEEIATAFGYPPLVLVRENHLKGGVEEGQILLLPQKKGNLYTVQGGDCKEKLCGNKEQFFALNGTDCFYPEQKIFI